MINVLEVEASHGWGGQEKRTARLANHMDETRVKTFFAAHPDSHLYQNQTELGIEVFPVALRQIYDLFSIFRLVKLIKAHDIHIVSTHSGKDAWLGGMAARLAGVKCVRVRHLQTPFRSTFSYKTLSDAVITVSEQVREYIISRGLSPERIHTVYTGIDTTRFCPADSNVREELGIAKETVVIGIIAVLRAAKRHKDLIEAFSKLPNAYNAELVIVGSGPQIHNIKSQIESLGLKNRVHMLGHRDDIPEILNSFDLFVLPSSKEALGTALLEAQACGVPVIGSRIGGIPECIIENETGLLFDPENADDLRRKIEEILGDAALWKEFSKTAAEHVQSTFSVEKMVENTIAVYEQVLSGKK